MNVDEEQLEQKRDEKNMRWMIRFAARLAVLSAAGVIVLLVSCYLLGPPDISTDSMTVFYDQEAEQMDQHAFQQQHTTLEDMSPYVVDATVAIEDRHFYTHYGFDIRRIFGAIWNNIRTQSLKEGASTITQQYARNLYLSHEKTWLRKAKEAFYTIRLEMFYDKDTILNGYLNTIYYGHGAYGIEAASQLYFEKSAQDLSLAEAAMLAGIPKGPTYYSPYNDEEKATERQQLILKRLWQEDTITQAEYITAKQVDLEFADRTKATDGFAPFFKDVTVREAADILQATREEVLNGGYHIYTTLDAGLQEKTEAYVQESVTEESKLEVGMITLRPETGAILSLIGGRNHADSAFNRAVDAERNVGSTFKPFLYYAALEHGFTPSTMLLSEPTSFPLADGKNYTPENYNGYYANKPITLAQALALSDNIYAVKTNMMLKPETVIKATRKFGITGDLPKVPSLALGSASIPLLDMTEAYGIIANGGKEIDGYSIETIKDRFGNTIYEREDEEKTQVLDPQKAFLLAHLMTGMFDQRLNGYMDVTGASMTDQLHHLYAGKSGTTDTDNWMIGFTPHAVTGVWTGYDEHTPIRKANDKTAAKRIWTNTIEAAHEGTDAGDFPVPEGIEKKLIDPETGLLATKNCPIARLTYFEVGTAPTETCSKHHHKKEKQKETAPSLWRRLLDIFG